jgi:hypothetical protein
MGFHDLPHANKRLLAWRHPLITKSQSGCYYRSMPLLGITPSSLKLLVLAVSHEWATPQPSLNGPLQAAFNVLSHSVVAAYKPPELFEV